MSPRRGARAFSLVEVSLALGVVAFALVGLLGLFPAGLAASRDNANETRAAQLAQSVFTTLRGQPLASAELGGAVLDLTASNQTTLYAAQDGLEITNAFGPARLFVLDVRWSPADGMVGDAAMVSVSVSWPPTNRTRLAIATLLGN